MKIFNGKKYIKFFIFLGCISYNFNLKSIIKILNFYFKSKNEILKIEKYFNKIHSGIKNIKKFKKLNYPKISIISPLYNRGKYIFNFLLNIQNQNFNDIEIIFIDDSSKDNTNKLIEIYKNIDKRIELIKNKFNRGTFICRNIGVIYSKGEYVILPDPDDIISKNILNICYNYAKKYNYEMIRFNLYIGKEIIVFRKIIDKLENRPLYKPKLKTYMFYGNNNELEKIDCCLSNKFIKRDIFIKALNVIKKYYLKLYIISMEDTMVSYILYRIANSFFFLKRIGYYYTRNSLSISKNQNKISKKILKFSFIYLKLIFVNSKNTKYEKDMANILLSNLNKQFHIYKKLSKLKNHLIFYKNIIHDFFKCNFITDENKRLLKNLKIKLKKKKLI